MIRKEIKTHLFDAKQRLYYTQVEWRFFGLLMLKKVSYMPSSWNESNTGIFWSPGAY